MRWLNFSLSMAAAVLMAGGPASAQTTTGTITGRVVDTQGGTLPGVTVTAGSTSVQGVLTDVTSGNGDYIFTLLPPGVYTVVFDLTGFQRAEKTVSVAPTQTVPVDVTMGPATVTETVNVVGVTADVLTHTAQMATNFKQDLIATLPTNRDISSTLLLAPGVHATGPSGNYSFGGSMTYESVFMVNGVNVNENLRGQPNNLYIEDAIQETTIASAGISAEYGRFGGGVVNMVTKSGSNRFGGSFRDTLNNDSWRTLVPKRDGDSFANDSKIDKSIPTYEYTFGGPAVKDRLWFFIAGRFQTQESNRQLVITNIPYTFTDQIKRFEEKVTYSLNSSARFEGSVTSSRRAQLNNTLNISQSMDLNSLYDRTIPEDLFTLNYNGILTPRLFVEARYSQRRLTLVGDGSRFTDLPRSTLLVDTFGRRYWSATFCGVCDPEKRDSQEVFVKGSWFLSTPGAGAHNMTFGYDYFNDKRFANNHQSGSDYRIVNAPEIVRGTDLYPQFMASANTQIQWNPIFVSSQGTNFRTHSLFYSDNWRVTDRLSANLGVRWDKNDGVNGNGQLVAKNSALSPRLGLVWDPVGEGRWSVTASAAKYVAGLLNSIADSTSPAGNADQYRFVYRGPDINADPTGPLVTADVALEQLFAWYFANGGPTLPIAGIPAVRGVSPQILDSLSPPSVWEYAGGVTRQLGDRGALRADVSFRKFGNFYIARTDTSTGKAIDTRPFAPPSAVGRQYDLAVIETDSEGILKRQYAGLTLQATYRLGARVDVGANYTLSRLWGNVDGETPNNGPISDSARQYPEFKQASWNYPVADLLADQRHRSHLWLNLGVPKVEGFTLSLLQALESGVPYSASNQNGTANGVNAARFVDNPGYLTPPDGSQTTYYFTARDAFRTEGQRRTDFAANYAYRFGPGTQRAEVFVQAQVINLFDQFQRCGCGASVFANGGNVQNQFIDSTVQTNVTSPALYQAFNPFTTVPVEGVHWAKGPAFGKALSRFAYTTPRTFRLSFGVRF